jgi:hypothetical protein
MNTIRLTVLGGAIALSFASTSGTLAKTPTYTVAPGTPVCTVGPPDNTIVCSWATAGLSPSPAKFAVEVLASYDPDCDNDFDLSRTFRFDTPDGDASFDVPASALDTIVCTSGDTPCTVPATYHAKSVQVRVKALNPPSRHGTQNNPFSGPSTALAIPGVCAAVCPEACVTGITQWLAVDFQSLDRLQCDYDVPRQAGFIIADARSFSGGTFKRATGEIFANRCLAAIDDFNTKFVDIGITAPEQAACATQFAPAFASKFGEACDISPP